MQPCRVLVLCVNYNSDDHVVSFLNSLEDALQVATIDLHVVLTDNSRRMKNDNFAMRLEQRYHFLRVLTPEINLGYFGGIQLGQQEAGDGKKWDYTIVSNVDITVSINFFSLLSSIPLESSVGAIAPSIFSQLTNQDRNPKILKRISYRKMCFFRVIFSNYILQNLYIQLSFLKNLLRKRLYKNDIVWKYIYAPHGSFMIFTKEYFTRNGHFRYEAFLFNEEIFVGELLASQHLLCRYQPELVINDYDHASTGRWRNRQICRYMRDATHFIFDTYYKKKK